MIEECGSDVLLIMCHVCRSLKCSVLHHSYEDVREPLNGFILDSERSNQIKGSTPKATICIVFEYGLSLAEYSSDARTLR